MATLSVAKLGKREKRKDIKNLIRQTLNQLMLDDDTGTVYRDITGQEMEGTPKSEPIPIFQWFWKYRVQTIGNVWNFDDAVQKFKELVYQKKEHRLKLTNLAAYKKEGDPGEYCHFEEVFKSEIGKWIKPIHENFVKTQDAMGHVSEATQSINQLTNAIELLKVKFKEADEATQVTLKQDIGTAQASIKELQEKQQLVLEQGKRFGITSPNKLVMPQGRNKSTNSVFVNDFLQSDGHLADAMKEVSKPNPMNELFGE